MTFIDWSDPDEMLGLLCEYVADEKLDAQKDPPRVRFLAALSADLEQLAGDVQRLSAGETIERLRAMHDSHADAFGNDPVLTHLQDCIEELERIKSQSAG
jgi:hypothetical protein